jgi:alpha-beta hydrolase superfamily lysophospholipase
MLSTTGSVPAADGTVLLTRHWPAVGGDPPWASVLLVHGLGEHSGRYEHVGEALATAGLDVHAYDARGFGGSGGRRAWARDWEQVLDDLAERLAAVREGSGGRPVALYGHSLGALIALDSTLARRPGPDLLVLSAPGLADCIPRWKHVLAPALDRVVPGLRLGNSVSRDQLAADPAPSFAYGDDPLVEERSTVHLGAVSFAAQDRVRELVAGLGRLPVPTLVVHGGADPLVPTASSEPLGRLPGVRRIVYPGLRHEVHNERGSPVVVDVAGWLRENVAVLESGHN